MKAILTFGRAWSALSAARSLGKRGIEIVVGDEYDFAPLSWQVRRVIRGVARR